MRKADAAPRNWIRQKVNTSLIKLLNHIDYLKIIEIKIKINHWNWNHCFEYNSSFWFINQ